MELNPIVRYELIRTARWHHHYAIRAALGLIPLYVMWVLYDWASQDSLAGKSERSAVLRDVPHLATVIFLELTWLQGLAVVFLLPGLAAESIALEDRRGTMLHLLATPLSSGAIVVGKLAARLAHVSVIVGTGVPFVVTLSLLGVLDPSIVVKAYAMLLALTLFTCSLSLLVSVIIRRPRLAIPAAYATVWGWLLLPAWYAPIVGRLGLPFAWLQALSDRILQSHPNEAVWFLWRFPAAWLFDPQGLTWAWTGFLRALPRVVAVHSACSLIFLLLAAVCLRPLRLGLGIVRARKLAFSSRPAIGDDPMLWKERYVHVHLPRGAVSLATVLVGLVLFGPLMEPAAVAFREWWANCWAGVDRLWARGNLNESLRHLSAGLYLVGIVAIAGAAATSVTGERERGTWTSLATTLITGREVTRAKVWGALWGVRGLSIPFLILWVIGLSTGAVHPLGALAAAAGLIVFARYAAALGVLISMFSSTSERAITAVLIALVASNTFVLLFVPLDLIGPLAGTWQTVYLAALTPLVEWVSLASPMEFQFWWEGQRWEARIGLPWGLWSARILVGPGLIRIYLVSLALHAIGTVIIVRAASWLFESQRDGSRRRSTSL